MAAEGLPRPAKFTLSKSDLLRDLKAVDSGEENRKRVLAMETAFRQRIGTHVTSLPTSQARFAKFNTNPFVLLFHSLKQGYHHVSEIESDILPAKLFMSMETSAGRMVEAVALPAYGWEVVSSQMHSAESVLDGKQLRGDEFRLATLKSGPRCLNDEMSKDIADDIVSNCSAWAHAANVRKIDFSYGALYGTRRLSNKKDWHILRNVKSKLLQLGRGEIKLPPENRWECRFELDGVAVTVAVRIGVECWNHIAGCSLAFTELCAALIRACVAPTDTRLGDHTFAIADLEQIISLDLVPDDFNVSILQHSQLEWLFFFARHFCDELLDCH